MTLPTRRLGTAGLRVTALGLGLAALGRPAYINLGHADDLGPDRSVGAVARHAHSVLDTAWDEGIRYFDAARSYGRAEEFLASWLEGRGLEPADVVVGSKWGYRYTAGWRVDVPEHEVKEHSLEMFLKQRVETYELLGAHLDVYQIHSATLESGVLEDRAVLGALHDLAAAGVVVGLSTSGPRQSDVVGRALEIGDPNPFSCVQATWNPLEPSAGSALYAAHRAGWGVIVKEAVANGRLTARGDAPERLRSVAQRLDVELDALALAAALAQPWASVILSGATTRDQLRSNLGALDVTISEPEIEDMRDAAESPDVYWAKRSALPWN